MRFIWADGISELICMTLDSESRWTGRHCFHRRNVILTLSPRMAVLKSGLRGNVSWTMSIVIISTGFLDSFQVFFVLDILEFDNTYSRFRSKNLHYAIRIEDEDGNEEIVLD